jgi:hypothetical protein
MFKSLEAYTTSWSLFLITFWDMAPTSNMVFLLHKFKHYLLGNKFVFYVDHMALVYLVNKPQVLGIITWWLLLFLKYDFTLVYKPGRRCS